MPGTTPLYSIPYPYETEVVDAASVENVADAVDTLLNAQITAAVAASKFPAALVKRDSGTQSFATGAGLANLTFTTEHYDNNGMGNLGVNNERLTIQTAGVYFVAGAVFTDSSNNENITMAELTLTLNGTMVMARKGRWTRGLHVALTKRLAVADILRLQYRWVGTSSPKNVTRSALGARWVCSL
jgi:hypothetical protein